MLKLIPKKWMFIAFALATGLSNESFAFGVTGNALDVFVVDGDTVIVTLDERSYNKLKREASLIPDAVARERALSNFNEKRHQLKLRIGNIDAPESTHYDEKKNTPEGVKASKFLKAFSVGKDATYFCYDFGHWGRAICNVALSGQDIAELMIRNGHTDYITAWGRNPVNHQLLRMASK